MIKAPIEHCFDLSRSIDFHKQSVAFSKEEAIDGVTSGLIDLGQQVEWRARHFGIWLKLRSEITASERPIYFQDAMVKGLFRHFRHDHIFQQQKQGTLMVDKIDFQSPVFLLGKFVDVIFLRGYLRKLLEARNQALKTALESDQWQRYLRP